MRKIKASEFRAKCLALMDEVARSGEPLLISKRGGLVAELSGIRRAQGSIWGLHKGQIEILGDILQPIDLD
jgi:antitoxin (DNA-binding transcriptional repressor) of toxin-antitoxin stability system